MLEMLKLSTEPKPQLQRDISPSPLEGIVSGHFADVKFFSLIAKIFPRLYAIWLL